MTQHRAGFMTRQWKTGSTNWMRLESHWMHDRIFAARLSTYWRSSSRTFLNVQKLYLQDITPSTFLHYSMQLFTLSRCYPHQDSSMVSEKKSTRKKKPLPLAWSLHLIEEERVNVARRTRERIALLCLDSEEEPEYSVDKATQSEIPMREVNVEIENWHTCLDAFFFCLLLLCMNLLYFQWLYTNTKLTRV